MDLHIKQRTLERLRMYRSRSHMLTGTYLMPTGVTITQQIIEEQRRMREVLDRDFDQPNPAIEAPAFPPNHYENEFHDLGFENFLRLLVNIGTVVALAALLYAIGYSILALGRHYADKKAGDLPSAQIEEGAVVIK